jgi:Tol biopolymer transport system component
MKLLLGVDGSGPTRVTRTDAIDESPAWGQDGSLVDTSNPDRSLELYALELATRETTRLTRTPQDETLPRVGPDGRFAFVVPLPGGGSRVSIATAALTGRRAIQAGTGVDRRLAIR